MDPKRTRVAKRVFGAVQGVGFRPFVARIAKQHGISGYVKNCGGYVEILSEGQGDALRLFLHDLSSFSGVLRLEDMPCSEEMLSGFRIIESSAGEALPAYIPADLPLCENCLRELRDPKNRRYRHAFISCTACGPRYSILSDIPYDRERTSMERFPLCDACREEYERLSDSRHYAQTICCQDCGPSLRFQNLRGEDALGAAIEKLRAGGVIAIKGIGGYHLAALPTEDAAVARLRQIKGRAEKPLAVMFRDLSALRACCAVSAEEEALLTSPAHPIVLLSRIKECFSPLVCQKSAYLGAFLPYTGYQQLLLDELHALVLTSANRSGAPMILSDEEARALPCDGVLWHTREIFTPLDDSVAAIAGGEPLLFRRARGYVPLPVRAERVPGQAFAAGGDLKASFGFLKGENLYLSQYLGDLVEMQNLARWEREIARLRALLSAEPEIAVCDLHPGYLSAARCARLGVPVYPIQHHFAHTLSVMAEHALPRAIGISFDGTGYGGDGTIWGGEFLLCNRHEFRRMGALRPFPLLGGDDAARDARKSALGALMSVGISENVLKDERFPILRAAITQRVNTVETTSAGRLFDAVSALLSLCMENRFEGACGEAVERAARRAPYASAIPMPIVERGDGFFVETEPLLSALCHPGDSSALAFGFHAGLAAAICDGAKWIRARCGENHVAISGGVFQNRLLLSLATEALERAGFVVLRNRAVPPGDGGLALGQLYWSKEETSCVLR